MGQKSPCIVVPVDAVLRVCNLVNGTQRLPELLRLILGEATNICPCRAASVFLRDGDVLRPVVSECELDDAVLPSASIDSVLGSFRLPIAESSIAGYCGLTREVLTIDDAYAIPATRPYSFNAEVDKQTGFRTQSILALPLVASEGDLVGVLELINREDAAGSVAAFREGDVQIARVFSAQVATAIANARWRQRVQQAQFDTVLCLGRAAEYRDRETYTHLLRISEYCGLLAGGLGLPADEVELLRLASPLHDAGKIGVPDAILKKPGRYTPAEHRIMQRHTLYGARILSGVKSPLVERASTIALAHHERPDGKGYPRHLRGDRIPQIAAITSVADVLDALTTQRRYKPAWSWERAVEHIRAGAGTQFLPYAVECLDREEPRLRRAWASLQDEPARADTPDDDRERNASMDASATRPTSGRKQLETLLMEGLASLSEPALAPATPSLACATA